MINEIQFKVEAVKLLELYVGGVASQSYMRFYKDKDIETVRDSLAELLSELIGEEKAKEQIKSLEKKVKRS